MKKKFPLKVVSKFLLTTISLMAASSALAQPERDDTATTVQITPYVWASGFGGTIRPAIGVPPVKVEKSFGELLEDVDAAFFLSGLVKHDRLIIVADLSHSSASRDGLVPTGNPALPFLPAQGALRQTSATALAGVRVADENEVSLDLLGGGRAWWLRSKVEVSALGLSAKATASFVDPVVAARVNVKPSPGFSVLLYGDIGGFGVSSDITAQAMATANIRVAPRIWLSGGYRYLHVDYKRRNFRANAALAGPMLGATFTF